jgi:hypothetical protein
VESLEASKTMASLLALCGKDTKFDQLKTTLGSIDLEEIRLVNETDFVDRFPAHDRLLALVFYRKYVPSFVRLTAVPDLGDVYNDDGESAAPARMKAIPRVIDGVLLLNSVLITAQFRIFPNEIRIPICEIPALLEDIPRQDIETLTGVAMAKNGLLDFDIPFVLKTVKAIADKRPQDSAPFWMMLTLNQFHGYDKDTREDFDQNLIALLSIPQISFVDLTMNPFSSVDRRDFFSTVNSALLMKLIWIPQPWVAGGGWKNIVSNRASSEQDSIAEVHKRYYASDIWKYKNF